MWRAYSILIPMSRIVPAETPGSSALDPDAETIDCMAPKGFGIRP
jgi:hypothetical protein